MKSVEKLQNQKWDLVISSRKRYFHIPIRDVWFYKDLILMLIKREIVVLYKQTILGPLWFFIQPVLTVAVYIIVFSRIAHLSTDGLPPILFYLSGIIVWNYFQESFTSTSKTFIENASLFGKVYFPRIVLPLSKVIAGLLRFAIQLLLFVGVFVFFQLRGHLLHPKAALLLVPVMVLIMGLLGLGFGILFTSVTTKYRDLIFLIQFGVQLLMYATPVIYPASMVPERYRWLILANPMTPVLEGFRFAFLGVGSFHIDQLMFSLLSTIIILILGLTIFNFVEKDFMDTV